MPAMGKRFDGDRDSMAAGKEVAREALVGSVDKSPAWPHSVNLGNSETIPKTADSGLTVQKSKIQLTHRGQQRMASISLC